MELRNRFRDRFMGQFGLRFRDQFGFVCEFRLSRDGMFEGRMVDFGVMRFSGLMGGLGGRRMRRDMIAGAILCGVMGLLGRSRFISGGIGIR